MKKQEIIGKKVSFKSAAWISWVYFWKSIAFSFLFFMIMILIALILSIIFSNSYKEMALKIVNNNFFQLIMFFMHIFIYIFVLQSSLNKKYRNFRIIMIEN